MKVINKEILKNTAEKLMFEFTDEECDRLVEEFDIIIKQMELIEDIDGVDQAERMTFPFEVTNSYLREDEPTEPLSKEEVLKNAPEVSSKKRTPPNRLKRINKRTPKKLKLLAVLTILSFQSDDESVPLEIHVYVDT